MSKTRAVLVGCGGISNAWLTPIKKFRDVEIVGLVDINQDNAEEKKETYALKSALCGTNLEQVLKEQKPDIVLDCTVPEAHCEVTLTALEHGCHVLGEKPMADSMENARKMVATAKEKDLTYAVIQNRRYAASIIQYKKMVQSGKIGNLTTLNADFYLGCHFGGFRDVMDHVLLLDMAIHSFDQARFISGADPVSVYCHEFNPEGSWYKHGASAMAIFQMSDGSVFNYRGSWCAEGLNNSWQCDWRAIGTCGTATWNGETELKAQKIKGKIGFMREQCDLTFPKVNPKLTSHTALIREFVNCVKNGAVPQTICTDNIKSLAMVYGAIESAESGKLVKIKI